MISCAACGSPVPPGGRYCPACGTGVSWDATHTGDRPDVDTEPDTDTDTSVLARPAPEFPPPGVGALDPGPHRPSRSGRYARWSGVALIVLGLALLAVGGYSTYRGAHGPRPGSPPGAGQTQPTPAQPDGPTAPADGTDQSGASATSSVGRDSPGVMVAPALVGQPDVADVTDTLTAYFDAINDRDYTGYRSVLIGADQRVRDEEEFRTRFRSTADSQIWLVGIRREPTGEVFATVTFRSRQDPVDSPDLVSDCLSWVVTYPMARIDGVFRIDVVRTFAQTHRPC